MLFSSNACIIKLQVVIQLILALLHAHALHVASTVSVRSPKQSLLLLPYTHGCTSSHINAIDIVVLLITVT